METLPANKTEAHLRDLMESLSNNGIETILTAVSDELSLRTKHAREETGRDSHHFSVLCHLLRSYDNWVDDEFQTIDEADTVDKEVS